MLLLVFIVSRVLDMGKQERQSRQHTTYIVTRCHDRVSERVLRTRTSPLTLPSLHWSVGIWHIDHRTALKNSIYISYSSKDGPQTQTLLDLLLLARHCLQHINRLSVHCDTILLPATEANSGVLREANMGLSHVRRRPLGAASQQSHPQEASRRSTRRANSPRCVLLARRRHTDEHTC